MLDEMEPGVSVIIADDLRIMNTITKKYCE